jgi:hypothetical protein
MDDYSQLIGKTFVFEDGHSIEVIQIKLKEVNNEVTPFVTFYTYQGGPMHRQSVMTYSEFMSTFGHLFEK